MKILFIHNFYKQKGGEDNVLANEQKLLEQHDHTTNVFSISNTKIDSFCSKFKIVNNLKYSIKYKNQVSSYISYFQPDIVHAHNLFPILTTSVYDSCKKNNVPIVQTLHNYRPLCSNALLLKNGKICEKCINSNLYWATLFRCYRNSFIGSFAVSNMIKYHRKKETWKTKVNKFIALTEFSKQKFVSSGFPEKKITVKPNFVQTDFTKKMVFNSKRQPSALFVGRLSHEKGIQILLNAWKDINYHLTIIGTGPLYNKLKNNKPDNITLIGPASQKVVLEKMLESSFLLMPSIWYEGFPMVIVEALACGLPVIASKLGSMEEIITNKLTGLHFEPGNVNDLKKAINRAIASPDILLKMGMNARQDYEQKYTAEKNYNFLINIYKDVIQDHKITSNDE